MNHTIVFSGTLRKVAALLALAASATLTSQSARADKFTNAFIEFEKPANWNCILEGAEFVCQSNDPAKKKEAIIVFAAKLKGVQDSAKQYLDYLGAAKQYTSGTGRNLTSVVKYAKTTNLREHPWVDSLHFESEIPGYYTRYLATIYKEEIGVLVTYSVSKDKYPEYTRLLEPMVNSLTVFRKGNDGLNSQAGPGGLPQVNIPRAMDGGLFPKNPVTGGGAPEKSKSDGSEGAAGGGALLLLLLAGAGVFLFLKKKKG